MIGKENKLHLLIANNGTKLLKRIKNAYDFLYMLKFKKMQFINVPFQRFHKYFQFSIRQQKMTRTFRSSLFL